MALKVAKRGQAPPFIVMDVLRAANEKQVSGAEVLHLEVGQPGAGAPVGVLAAARAALRDHRLGYTEALGMPSLRVRIARHYAECYGIAVPPTAGFDRLAPADGAFYLYADVGRLTNDSGRFCKRMLLETGVATAPGVDFDAERGHRFLRFSFAGAELDIARAVETLKAWPR